MLIALLLILHHLLFLFVHHNYAWNVLADGKTLFICPSNTMPRVLPNVVELVTGSFDDLLPTLVTASQYDACGNRLFATGKDDTVDVGVTNFFDNGTIADVEPSGAIPAGNYSNQYDLLWDNDRRVLYVAGDGGIWRYSNSRPSLNRRLVTGVNGQCSARLLSLDYINNILYAGCDGVESQFAFISISNLDGDGDVIVHSLLDGVYFGINVDLFDVITTDTYNVMLVSEQGLWVLKVSNGRGLAPPRPIAYGLPSDQVRSAMIFANSSGSTFVLVNQPMQRPPNANVMYLAAIRNVDSVDAAVVVASSTTAVQGTRVCGLAGRIRRDRVNVHWAYIACIAAPEVGTFTPAYLLDLESASRNWTEAAFIPITTEAGAPDLPEDRKVATDVSTDGYGNVVITYPWRVLIAKMACGDDPFEPVYQQHACPVPPTPTPTQDDTGLTKAELVAISAAIIVTIIMLMVVLYKALKSAARTRYERVSSS